MAEPNTGGPAVVDPPAITEPPKQDDPPADPPKEPAKEPEPKPVIGSDPPKDPPAPVVPDKYEINRMEGSVLEDSDVERIAAMARTQGLSNAQAQELLDTVDTDAKTQWSARVTEWTAAAKADKEIGGAKFDENAALANQAWDTLVPQDSYLRVAVVNSGIGSHPDFVRILARIGRTMAEDQSLRAGTPADEKKTTGAVLFDHPTSREEHEAALKR